MALTIEKKLRLQDQSMGIAYQEAAYSRLSILKEHSKIASYDDLMAKLNVVD
jgi:hypothetical protein